METSKKQQRANETVCYIQLNGNEDSVDHYLKQQKCTENSCIRQYVIKEGGNAEIVVKGGRRELSEVLKMFGILPDDIYITPPMKQYNFPASSVKDYRAILYLVGGGTRFADFGQGSIEIHTDMFPYRVARKLGGRESEIYVNKE